MRISRALFVSLLFSAASGIGADLTFVGKWKLDAASSDFGTETWTLKQEGPGELESVETAGSYKFKINGKPFKGTLGQTVIWKSTDPNTWEVTYNPAQKDREGYIVSTLKISEDGNTLVVSSTGTMWNGSPVDEKLTYRRNGTGTGLAGTWEAKITKSTVPESLEISPYQGDGLFLKASTETTGCGASLDGKPSACAGSDDPPNTTLALRTPDPKDLQAISNYGGSLEVRTEMSLSDDGRILTAKTRATGGKELTLVYDRQ